MAEALLLNVKTILQEGVAYLEKNGLVKPRRALEEVLCHILNLKRMDLYTDFDRPIESDELQRCRQALRRLSQREPWQYVVGEVEFYNCHLQVTQDVLIPRQETEILVDLIVKRLEKKQRENLVVWDLCTGSGAIGIALKKKFPELAVFSSDLSSKALAIAFLNAKKNGVEITFCEGDLFAPFQGKKCDVVICNPPYISDSEYVALEREVKDFEPKLALVSGATGLEVYEKIAEQYEMYLNPNALLALEIGQGQGNFIKTLFSSKGEIVFDWSSHDRFFFLENQ